MINKRTLLLTSQVVTTLAAAASQNSSFIDSQLATADSSTQLQLGSPKVSQSWIYGLNFPSIWYADLEGRELGIDIGFSTDVILTYQGLAFWLARQNKDFLVLNPSVFLEAAGHVWFELKLYFMTIKVNGDLIGYKASPLDYQATWDLDNKEDYCQSLGAYQDILDLKINLESDVNECFFGAIGIIQGGDPYDCVWRVYKPRTPVYNLSVLDEADLIYDYYPWTCTYYDNLATVDNESAEEREERDREIGAEGEGSDKWGGDGELEPSNVVFAALKQDTFEYDGHDSTQTN